MQFLSNLLVLFVLLSTLLGIAKADSNFDTVYDLNTIVRRAEKTSSNTYNPTATAPTITAASESTETASSSHNKGSSGTVASASSSSTSGHKSSDTTTNNKAAQYGNFASPSILEGGTLFYIGISVTTFLWVTGKIIDVKTERQERYAESLTYKP